MAKKYTIKDIAKMAGVSKGTVDRVLHNRGKVSQKALDSVNKILEEIDYQPNMLARSLKANRTYRIATLLPDGELDSYWLPCQEGIKKALKEYKAFDIQLEEHLFDPESVDSFRDKANFLLSDRPDAVLMAPFFLSESKEFVTEFKKHGLRVATFNNQTFTDLSDAFVGPHLFNSGRVAARLIQMLGGEAESAIVHIDEDPDNASHMQHKDKGYRQFFEQSQPEHKIYSWVLNHEEIDVQLIELLEKHPKVKNFFVTTSKAFLLVDTLGETPFKEFHVVGYDLVASNIDYLNKGCIDFLIHQNPELQTYLSLSQLIEHFVLEKELKKVNYLPIEIINSENAYYYTEGSE